MKFHQNQPHSNKFSKFKACISQSKLVKPQLPPSSVCELSLPELLGEGVSV